MPLDKINISYARGGTEGNSICVTNSTLPMITGYFSWDAFRATFLERRPFYLKGEHMDGIYTTFIKVLDALRNEAPPDERSYHVAEDSPDALTQARSKALSHLFLKVYFGITDFRQREQYVTDGGGDAGIDAYYIDRSNKIIYFIQTKFRAVPDNFFKKTITYRDLLDMHLDRVSKGIDSSPDGARYNPKIQNLIAD